MPAELGVRQTRHKGEYKILRSIIIGLLLISHPLYAQDVIINFKDGSQVRYLSSEIEKITFESGGKRHIANARAKWESGKSSSPSNAIDGDPSTAYHSAGTHDFDRDRNMWWEADLGSVQSVKKIRIFWHELPAQYWKEIEVVGSKDGRNYSRLVSRTRVNIDGSWTEFRVSGAYRFIKVKYVGSGSGGHGLDLKEFEIY